MIVFSGLDCSGKSTQIELLTSDFQENGYKVFVFWSRGGYTPGMQKIKDILRFFGGKKLPKSGNSPERDKALSKPIVKMIWLNIAMLDLIYHYGILLRIKGLFGYIVLCDRYLVDTHIDFKQNFPRENMDNYFLWRILNYVARRPIVNFISTISVSESIHRSKDKFEPFPDTPFTLEYRLSCYTELLDDNSQFIHLDGMQPIELLTETIKQYVYDHPAPQA